MAGQLGTWSLALGTLFAAIACNGPDHEAFCEKWSSCAAGNDKDIEACIVSLDFRAESSSIQGCTEEYNEYFECYSSNAQCSDEDTGVPCAMTTDCGQGGQCVNATCHRKDLVQSNPDACKNETAAANNCISGAFAVEVEP